MTVHILGREPVCNAQLTKDLQYANQRQMVDEAVKKGLRLPHLMAYVGEKSSIEKLAHEFGLICKRGRVGVVGDFERMAELWA